MNTRGRVRQRVVLATLAALTSLAGAASSGSAQDDRRPLVPEGLRATVTAEKQEYLLGERVDLELTLHNDGPSSVQFTPMTYQRGAVGDESVTLTMTDADGRRAWDPFSEPNGGGGPCPPPTVVAPGGSWSQTLQLWTYAVPDVPGPWTIKVSRHCGWREDETHRNPEATLTLRFVEPDDSQIDPILDGLLVEGRRAHAYTVCYDAYIPSLVQRAREGERRAVQGLALNRSPDALRALLDLYQSTDRTVAHWAGRHLVHRIRVPFNPGDRDDARHHRPEDSVHRSEDFDGIWGEEYHEAARAAARRFLKGEGDPPVGAAGAVLRLIGTAEDLPALARAIDKLADRFENDIDGSYDRTLWWDHDMEMRSAWRALRAMVYRGVGIPRRVGTAGEAMMLLWHLDTLDRPPQNLHLSILEALSAHPSTLVRRRTASYALSERWYGHRDDRGIHHAILAVLRNDEDERVREAATRTR